MNPKPPLIILNALIFGLTALAALTLAPLHGYLVGYQTETLVLAVLLWAWNGLSITAGYHRLWSHKAYAAHPTVQWFLAIGGAMALQNSILHWASDHRRHHKHVDHDSKDPYSASRGFWYSHIGWMLRNYQGEPDYSNARDLQKNTIVMFQHKHYAILVLATNIALPLLAGVLIGDLWGTLLMAGVVRLVAMHHGTFFINSLAHIWGSQPYSDKQSSRDNGVIALLTFGEGYHNFHHTFEYDWRNGIRWFHFDPTKWLIGALAKLKLASNLREVPAERIETAKLQMQLKQSKAMLLDRGLPEEWLNKLEYQYQSVLERMKLYYQIKQQTLKEKRQHLDSSAKAQLKEMKLCLQEQQQQWLKLRQQLATTTLAKL
ncbi:Delta-9 acyl-phospholipid desaturase [Ferrimonas sediminum]|uniref:Delta-9 acyl-phospholipid desaturase n=1 Tax=Ferrimonas sediminum TaxID=718193 RepID=A0A1G8ZGR3_9GAMM|nr:fatty acid desaturase [Ferrimonas sediminum]SDK14251.1 Delta-9 acyl-phospholipid desaturase [Ferrimonas sediminum]